MVNLILGYIVPFVLIVGAGILIKVYRDDKVVKYIEIAVRAAEQIFKGDGRGSEKFEYVSKWISDQFKISENDLKILIENAVYKINNGGK